MKHGSKPFLTIWTTRLTTAGIETKCFLKASSMTVITPKNISCQADPIQSAVLRPPFASAYIGVSRSYLYLLVERGELPLLKLGRRASGIMRSDLDAWLEKQRKAAIAA